MEMTTWEDIGKVAGSQGLKTLSGIWYDRKPFDEGAKTILRPVFERYSLGELNFKAWAKQRTRQLFENSLKEKCPTA